MINKFKFLDCMPKLNHLFKDYPYDDFYEDPLFLIVSKTETPTYPESPRDNLMFLWYLYIYEKFGNVTCGKKGDDKKWYLTTFELLNDSFKKYLNSGGVDKEYYRKVIGLG